jgi:DNA-binding NtrC family response regulator
LRRVLPESGALCRRVESLHGGLEISVQPGDAIKVFLYFPTAGEVSSGGPPEGSKTPAGKGYVLFMDDDEGVLETTTKLLEKMGFSPLTAKKGEEIIRIFSRLHEGQNPVSAVILDLDIPRGMGALRTLPVLKHIDPGLKVILTSGHTSHPVVRKYHRFGFAGVLIKPYDQKKLTEILQEVLFNSVEQDYP